MTMTRRTIVFLITLVVVAVLPPARPAQACSCAEMTLDSVVERHSDAAVARVLRVDDAGGRRGAGQVEQMIHGPQLPDEVPLHLDDGGSCQPG